jgi:glucose/arabinose dehydrogenase
VSASALAVTSAVITWTTNQPADSQVDYGATANYGQSTALDSSLTTSHTVALSHLTAATSYHYRVKSRNASGLLSASGDLTFSTAADATPPDVAIVSPADRDTVSGTITVSADASDDLGVTGVQFLLDGGDLNAEVASAPFATTWDTTTLSDGAHTLAARAHDQAGNVATSPPITINVSNNRGPKLDLDPPIGGFTTPLDLQEPDDGSGRLFVVEQGGKIRIIEAGTVQPVPFIDIGTRPGFTSGGETGLLGLAFRPGYAANGRFFVNYTRINAGGQLQTVIAEFRASPPSADTADPATERILFTWDQPFSNHNGGGLAFGADGMLYIGLGDGGSGGDPLCNGQNLATLLGKMLRIDVTTPPPAGQQYVIPASNPFVRQAGTRGEIWLYGLRNPFRFSFDKANGTDLYIGDVGQGAFEEVDLLSPAQGGADLGWNLFEGTHPFSSACSANGAALTPPIFDYSHSTGDFSITGGYVYRGSQIPALVGTYVFGDFVSGRVYTLSKNAQGQWERSTGPVLAMGADNLSSFGQGRNGELWVVRYLSGEVARIRQASQAVRRSTTRRR